MDSIREALMNVFKEDLTPPKTNPWLDKLKKDLLQNQYNLKKVGLYDGLLATGIENLLEILKDFED